MNPQIESSSPDSASVANPRNGDASATGRMGMFLFLVSLGVLFAASMVGYFVIRLQAESWPPEGAPPLPGGLWLSTGILVSVSLVMHRAMGAARRDDVARTGRWLLVALALGTAFLVFQSANGWALWGRMTSAAIPDKAKLFPFTFYLLTGLHAAHVIGGLIHLGLVSLKARRVRRGSADNVSVRYGLRAGVWYAATYWHFLDAVWVVMFVALVLAG